MFKHYVLFDFCNGSNNYITTDDKALFEMICKYYVSQFENEYFLVNGLREWNGKRSYEGKKEVLRSFAIDWQNNFSNCNYSYGELANWQSFFEEYGRKYGLIKEFKENAIC